MKKPLVSVIVPTYMREPQLISRALKSILNQTYSNIELIIVDDSPDTYEERDNVKKHITSVNDNRIKYIQHEKNLGANKARNTGIDNANGDFCAFLDDDDEWELDKIELQLAEFTSPDIALVYCSAIVINEKDKTVRPMINEIKTGYHYPELLRKNFIGSNSFVIIRTNILREVGKYDENLSSNQDYDLFLRIAKYYAISAVDKVLVSYFDHEGERITSNSKKQLQGRLGLYKKHKEDIMQIDDLNLVWEIKNIPLYYNTGKKGKAIKEAISLFIKHPLFFINYANGTLQYSRKKRQTTQIEA